MPLRTIERGLHAAYSAAASLTMALPPERETWPTTPAEVRAVEALCPAFTRVTLHAEMFRTLELTGPDEYFGLFMPPADAPVVTPPDDERDPRSAVAAMDDAVRPQLRWYTIRMLRPEHAEIDVDIVDVGHDGPGARWLRDVRVGDEVGVRVQSALYSAAPAGGHHVLIADETGLPGLLAIVDAARERATGKGEDSQDAQPRLTCVVEVPDATYLHPEVADTGITVVQRGTNASGSAAVAALADLDVDDADYAWVCAEGSAVAAIKRHLTKERGLSRRAITASGFWSVGRPRP